MINSNLNHIQVQFGNPQEDNFFVRNSWNQIINHNYTYQIEKQIGKGQFAVVYLATIQQTQERVAIKKVTIDRKHKNRELQILKELGQHSNIVSIKHVFYILSEQTDEIKLYFVMEHIQEDLSAVIDRYRKSRLQFQRKHVQIYSFQLFKALAFIHQKQIIHRDIKPQNILVDLQMQTVKICDFGSAKKINPTEKSVHYIMDRFYRAPELILHNESYSTAVDIWAVGCVIAEIILLEPLFEGHSSYEQIIEIMKVLGTPKQQIMNELSPEFANINFPQVKGHPWEIIFRRSNIEPDMLDLIKKMVTYRPSERITALQALVHPFFDQLKNKLYYDDIENCPEIFKFTQEEHQLYGDVIQKIVPTWAAQSTSSHINQ